MIVKLDMHLTAFPGEQNSAYKHTVCFTSSQSLAACVLAVNIIKIINVHTFLFAYFYFHANKLFRVL